MARRKILFVGSSNSTNDGLYQLFNRRFDTDFCNWSDGVTAEEIKVLGPVAIVVSMIGDSCNYEEIFRILKEKCTEIPVITVGTKSECSTYEEFYKENQFHKILRPVTGKQILDVCRSVIGGKECEMESEQDEWEDTVKQPEEVPHILIVDDNALVLRNIKSILEGRYSVAVAASGFQAFVSIGKKKPSLILLDYEMPELDGKAVMEKLQEDEELCDIPIVFLTSAATKDVVMKLLALKPAGYILKPTDSAALFKIIDEVLGR